MIKISEVKVGDFLVAQVDIYEDLPHKNIIYKKDKKYRILKMENNINFITLRIECENGTTTDCFGSKYSGHEFKFMSILEERKGKLEQIWK